MKYLYFTNINLVTGPNLEERLLLHSGDRCKTIAIDDPNTNYLKEMVFGGAKERKIHVYMLWIWTWEL